MTREERTLQIWQLLIGAAHNRQTLTSEQLGELIDLPARAMGPTLDLIHWYCQDHQIARLTVLVVHKHTGKLGSGITLEDAASERERVFDCAWYRLTPPSASDLTASAENHR